MGTWPMTKYFRLCLHYGALILPCQFLRHFRLNNWTIVNRNALKLVNSEITRTCFAVLHQYPCVCHQSSQFLQYWILLNPLSHYGASKRAYRDLRDRPETDLNFDTCHFDLRTKEFQGGTGWNLVWWHTTILFYIIWSIYPKVIIKQWCHH